jgi:hypothetical protein
VITIDDLRESVAHDREMLSTAARVRLRCPDGELLPGEVPSIANASLVAVLPDGTEVPLRGVVSVRFELGGANAARLSVDFVDAEVDVAVPGIEERA